MEYWLSSESAPGSIQFITHKYVEPANEKEAMDVKRCREIDRENQNIYDHNKTIVDIMNPLIKNLFEQPVRVHPPPFCYAKQADMKISKWISNPEVRLRQSIKYLFTNLNQLPLQDYPLEDAPAIADDLAYQKEIQRKRTGNIKVRKGEETSIWDGTAKRTDAGWRVRWKRGQGHSFLRPVVITETY